MKFSSSKQYLNHNIKLKRSETCIDSSIWSDLFFWKDDPCSDDSEDGLKFNKIQFSQDIIEQMFFDLEESKILV
jgi:hypothetical protein